jgi:hypothetical protein
MSVSLVLEDDLPHIFIDKIQVQLVLFNLVRKVLLQICRRGAVNSLLAVIRLRLRTMTRSRSAELPYHWLEFL